MQVSILVGRLTIVAAATAVVLVSNPVFAQPGWIGAITDFGPGEGPQVEADRAGNVFAVWTSGAPAALRVRRYSSSAAVWGNEIILSLPETSRPSARDQTPGTTRRLTVDADGTASIVWVGASGVYAAWYDVATDNWSPTRLVMEFPDARTLLRPAASDRPQISMESHAADDVFIVWLSVVSNLRGFTGTVHAARVSPRAGTVRNHSVLWQQFATGLFLKVVVDEQANATAVWFTEVRVPGGPTTQTIQAARFTAATGVWSVAATLQSGLQVFSPSDGFWLGVDREGTVTALWVVAFTFRVARYTSSGTVILADLFAVGSGLLGFDCAIDPLGNAFIIWQRSYVDAAVGVLHFIQVSRYDARLGRWSTPVAVSTFGATVGPMAITVDFLGNATAVWWSREGAGSDRIAMVASRFTASSNTWSSATELSVLASEFTGQNPVLTVDATGNVTALWQSWSVTNGNRIAGTRWSVAPVVPSTPANLLALVDGSSASLSWTNTSTGGVATHLWLDVSGATTARLPLATSETVAFAGITPGSYTVTVSAANAAGMSAPSNPVTLTVPGSCSGVPGMPTDLVAWTGGHRAHVSWSPPLNGAAVTGYIVRVTGTYEGSFITRDRALSSDLAAGNYVVGVAALNACGIGPATEPRTLAVP